MIANTLNSIVDFPLAALKAYDAARAPTAVAMMYPRRSPLIMRYGYDFE